MLCQNNTRMVNAVEAKHPGKFKVDLRPRDSHRDELKAHGIESHGVVCVNNAGETLWKHGDHKMSQAELDCASTSSCAAIDSCEDPGSSGTSPGASQDDECSGFADCPFHDCWCGAKARSCVNGSCVSADVVCADWC